MPKIDILKEPWIVTTPITEREMRNLIFIALESVGFYIESGMKTRAPRDMCKHISWDPKWKGGVGAHDNLDAINLEKHKHISLSELITAINDIINKPQP